MRLRLGTTVGALVAAGVLVAAPTIGQALSGEPGGQPPAGTTGVHPDVSNAGPEGQPPAGAPAVRQHVANAGPAAQPPNPHPQEPGAPTQLGDDEPHAKPHLHQVDHGTASSGRDAG